MSHPSLSVAGNLRITAPVNEPVRDHRPGSPEAVALHAELDRVRGEVRELRNVINGERLPLGATIDVVAPHDHAHVLGRYSPPTPARSTLRSGPPSPPVPTGRGPRGGTGQPCCSAPPSS